MAPLFQAIMSLFLLISAPGEVSGKKAECFHPLPFVFTHVGAHDGHEEVCFFIVELDALLAGLCI